MSIHYVPFGKDETSCGHFCNMQDVKKGFVTYIEKDVTCKECRRLILPIQKTPTEVKKEKEKIDFIKPEKKFSFFDCNNCTTPCRINSQMTKL